MELMKEPKGLFPVKLKNLDKFTVERGDIVERCSLITSDGSVLCPSVSAERGEYLEKLINMKEIEYDIVRKAIQKDRDRAIMIAQMKLPRQPIQRMDSRQIRQTDDGAFLFEPTKEYYDRRKYLLKTIGPRVKQEGKTFPIKRPISIECVFRINKKPEIEYSLTELILATLDHLVDLKIIKNSTDNIVKSTNDSKICYTDKEPYTLIAIREVEGV